MIVMGVESSCDETGVGIVEWTPGEGDGPGAVTLLAGDSVVAGETRILEIRG